MKNYRLVFNLLLAGGIILAPISQSLGAQPQPTNPLEIVIDSSDPVIPLGYQKRELSTFEVNRIKREMARLKGYAKDELRQDEGKAFALWYRYLRLARVIGIETEIIALGEVGEAAWQANRGEDVRNIANRLINIQPTIEIESASLEQMQQLATAFEQVRYLEQAIAIYQQILLTNQAQGNLLAAESNRQTLGELYLAQFNYPEAATIYQKLLAQAQAKSSADSQADFYLQTLADIYDRTEQTKLAIATKNSLIQSYAAANQTAELAKLELAIANDYAALNQTQQAVAAYKQAFNLASAAQQFAIANDALLGLGQLYQNQAENDQAIAIFNQLLDVQRQSYDYYGLLNTYDRLGTIYLKSAQKKLAKQYFQQALELAKDLNYKVNYFSQKINQRD